MSFEDTSLHAVEKLGGMGPIGSGSLGATVWQVTTLIDGTWVDTSLDAVQDLGGMGPIGSGSLGATVWAVTL